MYVDDSGLVVNDRLCNEEFLRGRGIDGWVLNLLCDILNINLTPVQWIRGNFFI